MVLVESQTIRSTRFLPMWDNKSRTIKLPDLVTEWKVLKGNGETNGGLDSDLVEHLPILCTQNSISHVLGTFMEFTKY